jgi:hypothetical protein
MKKKPLKANIYEFLTIGLIVTMLGAAVFGLYMIGRTHRRCYDDIVHRVEELERKVEKNESDVQAAWDDLMRLLPKEVPDEVPEMRE